MAINLDEVFARMRAADAEAKALLHETIEDRIAVLDDAGLLKLCHDLANRVSFYEAAEGDSYRKEKEDREQAKKNFYKVSSAVTSRGLTFDTTGKNYML